MKSVWDPAHSVCECELCGTQPVVSTGLLKTMHTHTLHLFSKN